MTGSAPCWTRWAWPTGCGSCRAGWTPCSGAGGVGLSAGQAQVLACARIFLRDPDVVILDEASSRLDPATERLVQAALGRLLDGRTGIIVAHRLATVAYADDILVLEDGRVREHGPRLALAADPTSRFAGLLRVAAEEVARMTPLPTWRYLLEMARFAPWLYLLHAAFWSVMNLSALLPGLIARAFFDTLTGKAQLPGGHDRADRAAGACSPSGARPCGWSPASSRSSSGSR